MRCGHCKKDHSSVAEVRACSLVQEPTAAEINAMMPRPTERGPKNKPAEEGMYRVGETIYKVQIAHNGSGRPYAKELVVENHDNGRSFGKFEIAKGMVYKLLPEHKLSIEEAEKFGQLYGFCCVCSRTLTDEDSIARGIGPVCAEKYR